MEKIETQLAKVQQDIQTAYASVEANPNKPPTLVAVGKKQPKEYIIRAYECGQRDFGENYIQELYDKATDPTIIAACPDIQWHLIGHLQTNKVKRLLDVPNLYLVQTVDSIKLAQMLENQLALGADQNNPRTLNILIQVNTSGEEAKSGTTPETVTELFAFVRDKCPHLQCLGLMTIGIYGFDPSQGETNPDFVCLAKCRQDICAQLGVADWRSIELSMGMSCDYEHAVSLGQF